MKKLSLCIIYILSLALLVSGCGVRADLEQELLSTEAGSECFDEEETIGNDGKKEDSLGNAEDAVEKEEVENSTDEAVLGDSDTSSGRPQEEGMQIGDEVNGQAGQPDGSGQVSSDGTSSNPVPGDSSQNSGEASTPAPGGSSQNSGTVTGPSNPNVSQTAHAHNYQASVYAPTCASAGYTRYSCSCGNYYNADFVAPLSHTYGDWEVTAPPTYTAEGQKQMVCSGCGNVITGTIQKLVDIQSEMNAVVELVNQERQKAGLAPLAVRADLQGLAAERAVEIVGLFSHDRPAGKESYMDFMRRTGYALLCENIAKGQRSAAEVMNSWMNSPGHRGNILNPSLKYIGVGCYYTDANGGMYCWTQEFGG